MDGLDLTIVLDCRVWVVVVGFSITRMGRRRSRARRTGRHVAAGVRASPRVTGQRSAQNGANFDSTAKAISQLHFHNKAPVGRRGASDQAARRGGRFDTGRNQREPLPLESGPAQWMDQEKPMSGRRV